MKERIAEPGCCQCRYRCAVRYGVSVFAVPVLFMKQALEGFLVIMVKKEMNYRVICPVAWVIMNFWLILIVILADNQIPRRLSIGVWVISGVSVMVALWMVYKELQKMLK